MSNMHKESQADRRRRKSQSRVLSTRTADASWRRWAALRKHQRISLFYQFQFLSPCSPCESMYTFEVLWKLMPGTVVTIRQFWYLVILIISKTSSSEVMNLLGRLHHRPGPSHPNFWQRKAKMSKAVAGFSADWASPGAAIKRQKEKKQELDIERKSVVKIMIYSTLKFQILFLYKVKPSSFGLFIGDLGP